MKSTLKFLSTLKNNNNRDWFEANKEQYVRSKEELEEVVGKLISGASKFDPLVKDLEPKNCIFRIYKDVRFSKDKTPYKTNLGASITPGGKKIQAPGYYFHVEPGKCFVAGGLYMPTPEQLAAIRQEIDYNADDLLKIFKSKAFSANFNGLDEIDLLKTTPKGYDKDHKHLNLLKHNHFIVSYDLKDKDLLDAKAADKIISVFKSMYPFMEYLRHAIEK
jgi:uncharacterized protein (TIGR02453 family)